MFTYETLWDVYEFKFVVIFISVCVAIVLGNWIYEKKQRKK